MIDYRLALMAGIDIPIPECQIAIHQPTIEEIAYIGEQDFFIGIQCLCIDKNMVVQDENVLSQISNFQIFMTVMSEKETADKKEKVMNTLTLLFPDYNSFMTPRALVLSKRDGGETITIDESNFTFLQNVLSEICCISKSDQSNFNPGNEAAKKIAEKLMKARKKVAEIKAAEGGSGSAFAQHISVLTVGLGSMSLKDCLQLTIYQLQDLMERYGLFINWDIDMKSRLAGGKPDKPAENWMKNIH